MSINITLYCNCRDSYKETKKSTLINTYNKLDGIHGFLEPSTCHYCNGINWQFIFDNKHDGIEISFKISNLLLHEILDYISIYEDYDNILLDENKKEIPFEEYCLKFFNYKLKNDRCKSLTKNINLYDFFNTNPFEHLDKIANELYDNSTLDINDISKILNVNQEIIKKCVDDYYEEEE